MGVIEAHSFTVLQPDQAGRSRGWRTST
jgi:hypothetical protein